MKLLQIHVALLILIFTASCGVKGPPLPPVPTSAESSDSPEVMKKKRNRRSYQTSGAEQPQKQKSE